MLTDAGARSVVGVDLSEEAISFAQGYYGTRVDRSFVMANLETLPFPSGSFDLVACFETIEHVQRPAEAVRELARVLVSTGTLLMSSPNGSHYPGGHSGNPYHYKEFRTEELAPLLNPYFARLQVFGQRLTRTTPGILDYSGRSEGPSRAGDEKPSLRRRLFSRLPFLLQDQIWRLFRGEPYYPREDEFVLEAEHPERFPVLVAVCQRDR